ncbi:hypothetical protein B2G50_09030 [Leptospira interrogans serovar Canicola]|nr:hypothetical protein B2G50_09030 [Leptospira interrogans serovar Canicola]
MSIVRNFLNAYNFVFYNILKHLNIPQNNSNKSWFQNVETSTNLTTIDLLVNSLNDKYNLICRNYCILKNSKELSRKII